MELIFQAATFCAVLGILIFLLLDKYGKKRPHNVIAEDIKKGKNTKNSSTGFYNPILITPKELIKPLISEPLVKVDESQPQDNPLNDILLEMSTKQVNYQPVQVETADEPEAPVKRTAKRKPAKKKRAKRNDKSKDSGIAPGTE